MQSNIHTNQFNLFFDENDVSFVFQACLDAIEAVRDSFALQVKKMFCHYLNYDYVETVFIIAQNDNNNQDNLACIAKIILQNGTCLIISGFTNKEDSNNVRFYVNNNTSQPILDSLSTKIFRALDQTCKSAQFILIERKIKEELQKNKICTNN